MKTRFQRTVVWMTCCTLLVGQLAQAAAPAVSEVRDVELQAGGVLRGALLDQNGAPQVGQQVVLVRDRAVQGAMTTAQDGQFEFRQLTPGMYELYAQQNGSVYRVWAPRTAPPAALDRVLLVNSDEVARANLGNGGLGGMLANPWVLGLIVAAAIAIPIALDDSDAS